MCAWRGLGVRPAISFIMGNTLGPDTLTIEIAPGPGAVATAAIVSFVS